jgi:hypothetical protein
MIFNQTIHKSRLGGIVKPWTCKPGFRRSYTKFGKRSSGKSRCKGEFITHYDLLWTDADFSKCGMHQMLENNI